MLFLCVHNAGRSQMALGWFNHLAGGRAVAWSGGSEPGAEINPAAVAAMAEVGIDITAEFPKPWTEEIVEAADVVVTMGCGDACPFYPGKRYDDWELDDPAGLDVAAVRPIRDEIRTARRGPARRAREGVGDRVRLVGSVQSSRWMVNATAKPSVVSTPAHLLACSKASGIIVSASIVRIAPAAKVRTNATTPGAACWKRP